MEVKRTGPQGSGLFFASEAVKEKGSDQVYPGSINKAAPELGRYTSRGKRSCLCAGVRVGDDGWAITGHLEGEWPLASVLFSRLRRDGTPLRRSLQTISVTLAPGWVSTAKRLYFQEKT